MLISVWDSVVEISEQVEDFMIDNFDEPFLWIGIFVALLAIAYFGISKLANK